MDAAWLYSQSATESSQFLPSPWGDFGDAVYANTGESGTTRRPTQDFYKNVQHHMELKRKFCVNQNHSTIKIIFLAHPHWTTRNSMPSPLASALQKQTQWRSMTTVNTSFTWSVCGIMHTFGPSRQYVRSHQISILGWRHWTSRVWRTSWRQIETMWKNVMSFKANIW